jgi:two-component system, NtrC family, nitrogen regulation sensor histidine kinase NtrY
MLKRRSLEGRLFGRLFVMALVPTLLVLLGGVWVGARVLDLAGSLGPWEQVADSGKELLDALAPATLTDARVAAAAKRHRAQLSESLVLARRWAYLGQRAEASLPVLAVVLAMLLALTALLVSRRLARQLARPIAELVGWAGLLAQEAPLPAPAPAEAGELREIAVLRAALRRAAEERERARARALEAERTRAWGEMARRVAHEMKNPLTPLRLAAHRLSTLASSDPALVEPVAVLDEETTRLELLAARFSDLGRPAEGPSSAIDVEEMLRSLLATDVPPGVECSLQVEADVPDVEGHYDALLRAFRNLIRNAVEAVESSDAGGRIEIGVEPGPRSGGAGVRVVIGDTGPGIPEQARERIFEPDFTTKSRGTGLGLAIVRQAIRRDGGEVLARSRPSGGTELVVWLPARGHAAGTEASA